MLKKCLSILLAAVMIISLFTILPFSANAMEEDVAEGGVDVELVESGATRTQAEAVQWIKDRGNEGWWDDVDGVYGCQCVDLIQAYYQYFGYSRLNGNAYQYQWDHIPSGSNWYYSNSPIPGSVFVKAQGGYYDYGHVGLVYAVDGSTMYTVETNLVSPYDGGWDYAKARFRERNVGFANTFINPDFNSGPVFTPTYMGERFFANIIHQESGKAVAAIGDNAGDNVELQTLDGKLLHKWEFIHQGNNIYKIYNNHSGKCLDVNAASSENGANIQVWDSNDSDAQLWYFKTVGSGYSLVPKCAQNRSLDINNGYSADGTNIQIWESWDGSPQILTLNYLPSFVAQNLGKHFFANIINPSSGKAVVAVGDNAGDNVELQTLDGQLLHKWEFIRNNDWSYKIVNNHSGKCLDVNAASSENGANIQVWNSNDSYAQLWYFKAVGNGYSLVPKCSFNSCLDLYGGYTADGTNIQLWESWDGDNQIFYLNLQSADIALDIGESFDAYLVHSSSGYAVSYNGVGNVVVQPNETKSNQLWHFEKQNDVSYIITNWNTEFSIELTLEVEKNYTSDGSNVQVGESTGTNHQKWFIIENGDGYSLIPKCAVNKAMDLKGGKTEDSNIEIRGLEHNNTNQIFDIIVYKPISSILGDADEDENVTILDATCIQKKLASLLVSSFNEQAADVDKDKTVTIIDATFIQKFLADLSCPEGIGEPIT